MVFPLWCYGVVFLVALLMLITVGLKRLKPSVLFVLLTLAHFSLENVIAGLAFGFGESYGVEHPVAFLFRVAGALILLPLGWLLLGTPLHLYFAETLYQPIYLMNSLTVSGFLVWLLKKSRK